MFLDSFRHRSRTNVVTIIVLCGVVLLWCTTALAQTTISTGSIQGTVTDPSGAVVTGAKITISNKSTGRVFEVATTSAGTYTSGALTPGDYAVKVEAPGFKTEELQLTVLVGVTAAGNAKLQVGQASQVVQVQATEIAVNTEQATVQGVLNAQQIENLPINGRNFLDLAQLEPGVQIQDGGDFDPTKNGFSSISFGGRFGRTARIEVDGLDISDETVGTTTQNVPASGIQEFQIQQSSLDLSTELTSSGSVNVTTKSGTNTYHGEAFYLFRDQALNANLPGASDNYFQRNQFGGNFGGAIVKDQLFFFIDIEHNKQDLLNPVLPSGPFAALVGKYDSPFRETEGLGRLDWVFHNKYKMFYRFSYDQNRSVLATIPNSFQPFANRNNTPDHAVGVDFNTGGFTHSIRFGYMKFRNAIVDATAGTGIYDPLPNIELAIGTDPDCLTPSLDFLCSGPSYLAPQQTYQTNWQIKYDGSKAKGPHILRYGGGLNRIFGGGFASFLGLGPAVNANLGDCTGTCVPSNPLSYPVKNVILGNGVGYATEMPAFGFPAGGTGPDYRLSAYIGDTWKIKPNLTLTYGLRYVRDTWRSDSDLGPIPFVDQWGAGLGNRVNQPDKNFAPQLGVAWDPSGRGKTVLRGGIGLFYENAIWNNTEYDRPARLQKGLFLQNPVACTNGSANGTNGIVTLPGGDKQDWSQICDHPIGQVASLIAANQAQYQAATIALGSAANPGFIGTTASDGLDVNGTDLLAPNYVSPRSVQINLGLQHEIRPGMVFTADYLRNIETHTLLAIDTNHVGDARFFNLANAQAAIAETLADCGVTSISAAIASCPGLYPSGGGATIADFASHPPVTPGAPVHGLDSGYSMCSGGPCPLAAFPGMHPNLGANQMLFPAGRAEYNGFQFSLRQDVRNPFKHISAMTLQVSWALSKYIAPAADNDFINIATDFNNPLHYIGPNGLDRHNQISFGGTMDLPYSFRIGMIGHFYSPLPVTITLPTTGLPGGIFVSDVTGDGTGDGSYASNGGYGDVLPGTNIGAYARSVNASNINKYIQNYNQNYAGQPTPAGQVLIQDGLFTLGQLVSLQAVQQQIQPAPANQANQRWMRDLDLSLNWIYKTERWGHSLEVSPGVSFFNLMNLANFDGSLTSLSGVLSALGGSVPGTVNGTSGEQPSSNRLGLGSGVFALGSPRVIEFSMKFSF